MQASQYSKQSRYNWSALVGCGLVSAQCAVCRVPCGPDRVGRPGPKKGKVIFQTGGHSAWPGPAAGPLSAVTMFVAASEV